MLKRVIEFTLKYRVLVVWIFIALSIFGYKAYKDIAIDAFPDITPKQVVIYTQSAGNSAEDIEKLITYPIESALSGMAGVKMILSNSIFGLSYVSVFFEDDLDIYFLRQLVAQRLSSVDIPDNLAKPVIGPNTTGLGQVFWYELKDSTQNYSLSTLRELQEYVVKPLLKSVSGVEEVISWGGEQKEYDVVIDPKKLKQFGITYSDIVKTLQKSNQIAGGSYLVFNKEQYLIRANGLYKTLQDIKNSVIISYKGRSITIGDVADVTVGSKPRFGAISIDTKESVMGMVLQRTDTNANEVVKNIKKKIATINATLPKGVELKTLYDRTQITTKALNTMNKALISGVILVGFVLFLFLFEFRSAFIVILSLPLSLLFAFLLMKEFNLSANLMSLSGLAIAVGMIVDGTIVIVENSFRKLHENPKISRFDTVSLATKEVITPVTFAILIIVAVFIPLLTLDGLAGKLYSPMAINIVFVMISSLVVALFLVPILILLLLKPTHSSESFFIKGIKKLYLPILNFTLMHTKKLLFIVSIAFIALAYMLSLQGREFMPKLNEESIMYRVIAIPGTALSQSVLNAKNIESYILKNYSNSVESVLSMIGRSEKGETAQSNYMEVLLILKPNIEDLAQLRESITQDLKEHFNYLVFVPTQPIAMRIEELLEGVQAELAIKIYGQDQKIMSSIAKDIIDAIGDIDGLEHIELEQQLGQALINIKPNYLALSRYGIEVDEVIDIIRYGVAKEGVTQKIEGVKRFDIVAVIKDAKKDIESLKNITLHSKSGAVVTLNQVCDIELVHSPAFIKRENLSRYMVLSMEVNNRDIASFVDEASKIIDKKVDIPSGYYIDWAGDFKNMQEATDRLLIIIPLTLIVILLLLYTAFNTISKALLIILNVPFGLMGGIIALILSNIYLSVSAIIGFLAIFAIAILNGIVLVSFIDELRVQNRNMDLLSIVKKATLLRVRPVLMTAFTTLFGILPLLYASGVGSEIHYPLAVVITGGIISSTILTLLILPATYILFYKNRQKDKK